MSELLDDDDRAKLEPAARKLFRSPIPTHPISNGEFMVGRQTEIQRKVEGRIRELAGTLSQQQGMSRRAFLRSASGMAAAFLAMNEFHGPLFAVSSAEAATPDLATQRARALSAQFIIDCHTHFLRPDARPDAPMRGLVGLRTLSAANNPELARETQTYQHLGYGNYVKEMFLDSDTKVALISGAPAEDPMDWFLTNDMKVEARDKLNAFAGSRRMLAHSVFSPTAAGWLDEVDRCVETLKPDSWKAYTIGDNLTLSRARAWRLDDEQLVYRGYERFDKAGSRTVCVHKGLFPPSLERNFPHLAVGARVDDVAKAAKDWPQLNFAIYHAGYRHAGGPSSPDAVLADFERTGRIDWVTDLAEIPARHGVTNVYADIGATFASLCVDSPRLAAALLGTLIRGLGADHVLWGTDCLWYGSPQWLIEALRRLEIPEDMQKKHGFAPLGPADGAVKSAIFGRNSARLYNIEAPGQAGSANGDKLADLKADYEASGGQRSNLAYGYIRRGLV